MSRLFVIVGGQFGSEAKGHVAAQYAARSVQEGRQVLAVRVAGPNAGHTAYDSQGRKFALRQIPVMAVVDPDIMLYIGPGSEINPQVLVDEIKELEGAGHPILSRLFISSEATVLTENHITVEVGREMHERMGSTAKGVGACRADRIMRTATTWGEFRRQGVVAGITEPTTVWADQKFMLNATRQDDFDIIVEGTQGYGLGLHAGYYPHCTSSDCRSIDFLAMAGIDPWWRQIEVYLPIVVLRTFPIRVAGPSGKLAMETSWDTLAKETDGYIKPEFTTVTKKMRRVGRFDRSLARNAMWANGGPGQALAAVTFLDYLDPSLAGSTSWDEVQASDEAWGFLKREILDEGYDLAMVTTGPQTCVWVDDE